MVSFEVRWPSGLIASVLMLVTVATVQPASSQPLLDLHPTDSEDGIFENIVAAYTRGGRYSAELIPPLTALSLQYQDTGRHVLALATIEQALQIVRANYGLRSLEQVPLIRQRIINQESLGNFAQAWNLEEALLQLARANPDDLRAVSVFREIGDKRMNLLERYLGGEWPPQIVLGCFYRTSYLTGDGIRPRSSCTAGSKKVAIKEILVDAQRHYADAIDVLVRLGHQSSSELRELELDLISGSYLYGSYYPGFHPGLNSQRIGAYETGREHLTRRADYDVANAEPLMTRVDALMNVADWDLLFERPDLALEKYQQIYQLVNQQGQTELDAVFSPDTPVLLPTFLPNPLVADDSQATRYIDVAFDVSRFGTTQRIKILDTSNASAAATQRVVDLISRSRFRPRITAGEVARISRFEARYFVNE